MPMNTHREQICREVLHTHDIIPLSATKSKIMGPDPSKWCKYHMVKSHHMKDFYQLKTRIK